MKRRLSVILVAALCACNTVPRSTALLSQASSDYFVMRNDPDVEHYAPIEMRDATAVMNKASEAAAARKSAEEVDNLSYLAKSKIAFAMEISKQKRAEDDIAQTIREHDQLVLKQRAAQAKLAAQAALAAASTLQHSSEQAQARSAKLESELAELIRKKTDRGIVVTLGDVLFGFDSATLNSNGLVKAKKLACVLQLHPERKILIEGYTDATGPDNYNQLLSERRAAAVQSALLKMGIDDSRMQVRGYGKAFPAAPNDSDENRHLNRRVEIVISDENGKILPR